jgi:2-methylcitrate dehydratase PrpD
MQESLVVDYLAKFVMETTLKQMPKEAFLNAKKCLLDGLGVALSGSQESSSRMVIDYVKHSGGRPEAGVIGTGFKVCCDQAALANGTMAHALDFDDMSASLVHFTSVLMPTVSF